MVRASDRCTEGQRFNSCWGLKFFSLSRARDMLITSFLMVDYCSTYNFGCMRNRQHCWSQYLFKVQFGAKNLEIFILVKTFCIVMFFWSDVLPQEQGTKGRFWRSKLPRIVGNLLHLEGGPRLMSCYFPGMGVRGFLLTSALLNISLVFFRKNQNPKDMVCTQKKYQLLKFRSSQCIIVLQKA